MAATQNKMIIEAEQMKQVLQELNTHPEARLFYALQERGATCGTFTTAEYGDSAAKLTLRVITERVNKHLYPSLTAFVDDMTMIFSSCPGTPLASGAAALRELFTELLSKFTSTMDAYTPPGKKKRFRTATSLPSFMEEDEDDTFFVEIDSDDDFGDLSIADESFGDEILHSEDRAALLELTEEIATIEAEIQLLKETKQDLHKDSSQPGCASHPSVLDALKSPSFSSFGGLYSSSQEEGRVLLNGHSKKRTRRNSIAKAEDAPTPDKRRRKGVSYARNSTSKQKQEFQVEIMTKEQLLYTITHELPPKFLEGVIRIVNPTFDPVTASEEDLEFDINLLDEEVLAELQQYVNKILKTPRRKTRPQTAKVTHRKESPKKRLQKEAPKKVNRRRTGGTRKRSSLKQGYGTAAQKKQQTLLAATLAKRNTFVSAEIMQQIFMKEEIVRVNKSIASEDEDVDILD